MCNNNQKTLAPVVRSEVERLLSVVHTHYAAELIAAGALIVVVIVIRGGGEVVSKCDLIWTRNLMIGC